MAGVTDPLLADCGGIDETDGLRMSTRQCAGRVVVAPSGDLDVADTARIGALLTTAAFRVLDLTGLITAVLVYSSVEEAAGVASAQRAARPVPEPDAQAIVAGLPTVGPGRQQEEGQPWPPPAAHRG